MVLYQVWFAKIMIPFNKQFHKKYYFQTFAATPIQLIRPTPLMQTISGLCDIFESNDKNKDTYTADFVISSKTPSPF